MVVVTLVFNQLLHDRTFLFLGRSKIVANRNENRLPLLRITDALIELLVQLRIRALIVNQ